MYKTLRIVFTLLSAVMIAAAIPVAVFTGLMGLGICASVAMLFFLLMLLCKQKQEAQECAEADETAENGTSSEKEEQEK